MEGLWKVWRHQKIINNSPDLDSYGKPLPPPPTGWYWSRLDDGSWELLQVKKSDDPGAVLVLENAVVLEHTVMPEDTLQGICLKYRVSAVTLRQYNNFSGSAFRSNKALRIPLEPGMPMVFQDATNAVLIQKFRNMTNEGLEEAKFYLEDHHWNLLEAVAALNGDTQWLMEHESKVYQPSAPVMPPGLVGAEVEMRVVPAKVVYSMDELEQLQLEDENTPLLTPLLG